MNILTSTCGIRRRRPDWEGEIPTLVRTNPAASRPTLIRGIQPSGPHPDTATLQLALVMWLFQLAALGLYALTLFAMDPRTMDPGDLPGGLWIAAFVADSLGLWIASCLVTRRSAVARLNGWIKLAWHLCWGAYFLYYLLG